MEWYIDAWDPMGGRAFATQRARNQDLAEHAERRGPTVYIGPPGFQPQQLANIAIAIAACHSGNFDPRLPKANAEDQQPPNEFAFPSPDSVADFVRRAFIGNGRGRGGGGGGEAAGGEGPQGPPEGEGGFEPVTPGLANYLEYWEFPEKLFQDDKGNSERVNFLGPANLATFGHDRKGPIANIEDGALQIIGALLATIPKGSNYPGLERWQSAGATLNWALSELGIWRAWFFGGGKRLDRANQYLHPGIAALSPDLKLDINDATLAARHLLVWPSFLDARYFSISDYLKRRLYYSRRWHEGWFTTGDFQSGERYEALFDWPVPQYAKNFLGASNVGQLLALFVCSPGKFVGKPWGVLDIIGFAAAFLNSRTEERTDSRWRERAAASWLGRSMPRYMFGNTAEFAILTSLSTQKQLAAAGA